MKLKPGLEGLAQMCDRKQVSYGPDQILRQCHIHHCTNSWQNIHTHTSCDCRNPTNNQENRATPSKQTLWSNGKSTEPLMLPHQETQTQTLHPTYICITSERAEHNRNHYTHTTDTLQ